jgi:hypothetical protein
MNEIVLAIIGSGAFFTFLQFILQRLDNKKNLESKIDAIGEALEEHKATLARTHILRFADEQKQYVKQNMSHSEEYFKQQLLDIKTYNTYCAKHPDFSNGLTVIATEYIEEEYKRLYMPHSDITKGGEDSK